MILNVETSDSYKCVVKDCLGKQITYVISFDTETCEIEMAVRIGTDDGGQPLFLAHKKDKEPSYFLPKFVLLGAYAEKEDERI